MRRRIRSAVGITMVMSGCAMMPPAGGPDPDLPATIAQLQAHREQGRTGSVWGLLYLREPGVPTPLKGWPVTMLPLTPELEAAVQQTQEAYRAGGYAPLPDQTLSRLQQTLNRYRQQLSHAGHDDLIRQARTETGEDPRFEFREVPEGRWLLLAALPSPPSLAVWIVPITVTAATATRQSLNDLTVIEGLIR
jgi:hypothetical protein